MAITLYQIVIVAIICWLVMLTVWRIVAARRFENRPRSLTAIIFQLEINRGKKKNKEGGK